MSGSIARVSSSSSTSGASLPDERTQKLRKAAGDFESLLVKQLLKEAKMGGTDKGNGYGDMAIDALASAVEKGGGLGLSKHIEQAVEARGPTHPPVGPTAPNLPDGPITPTRTTVQPPKV
ncbi:MAG: hypothetical protein ABSC94_17185 [Polyangiaceae bacterium]|jgi:Rod binding domain-containing protein